MLAIVAAGVWTLLMWGAYGDLRCALHRDLRSVTIVAAYFLPSRRIRRGLAAYAVLFGFGGAFLSLALSKWMAKRAMGVRHAIRRGCGLTGGGTSFEKHPCLP